MNDQLSVTAAIKDTLPTIFGYIGIGLAFGVIGHASGLAIWLVVLMSTVIYAGSAQFTTVSMLAAGNPVLSVILATFLINSRMLLMSVTLAPYFHQQSTAKNIWLGTLLTDESFALSMNKLNATHDRLSFGWLNAANLVAYLTWISATAGGALLGGIVGNPQKWGLDFAIVAMFMGLLFLQLIADRALKLTLQLWVVGCTLLLTYIGMIILPTNLVIIVVTVCGCGLGVGLKHAFF